MSTSIVTRDAVIERLQTVRAAVRASTSERSAAQLEALAITSEWKAIDILRHIWVWNELCARCLTDWHGSRDWISTFASEDEFNIEMVHMRATTDRASVLAGIEAAYQQYQATLASSEAELAELDAAPWGEQLSRLNLIYSELGHDLQHLQELRAAQESAG